VKTLVIIPTPKEYSFFLDACKSNGLQMEDAEIGLLPVVHLPELDMTVARGGLGKVQFAIHTQHLLDFGPDWDLVICTGAAGALSNELSVGDVVVATETVEHDINNHFGAPLTPRFAGDDKAIAAIRSIAADSKFPIHFQPVASGDEDVIGNARRKAIRDKTGAIAVAWEGAGGARACHFSNMPYLEIRGISDGANRKAVFDYFVNLASVMQRLAELIFLFVQD